MGYPLAHFTLFSATVLVLLKQWLGLTSTFTSDIIYCEIRSILKEEEEEEELGPKQRGQWPTVGHHWSRLIQSLWNWAGLIDSWTQRIEMRITMKTAFRHRGQCHVTCWYFSSGTCDLCSVLLLLFALKLLGKHYFIALCTGMTINPSWILNLLNLAMCHGFYLQFIDNL